MAFTFTQATHKLDKPILQALDSTGLSAAVHELGYTVNSQDGRQYRYVKFVASGGAAVAGAPCVWAQAATNNTVTEDVSDASLVSAGAFVSILTDGYFGWIQTKGNLQGAPATDGAGADVAAGDPLGATADDLWTKVTVGGTTATTAIARAAGSGGFANIELVTMA